MLTRGAGAPLAVALDRNDLLNEAETAVQYLAHLMQPVLMAKTRRTWGGQHDGPPSGWRNSISDTFFVAGLFKPGKRHSEPLTLNSLEGAWELVE